MYNIRHTLVFAFFHDGAGVPVATGMPDPFFGTTGRARIGPARFSTRYYAR